jgi:hypothetical protein
VIEAHTSLTLQAAQVAASALRAIHSLRPILGRPNGEVTGFEQALDALQALYRAPKPKRPRPKRIPKPRAPRALARGPQTPAPAPAPARIEELDERESPWDPEPLYEASRCQALLMEIIRRAAHDYVLYRQHRRLELKALADQAYTWLFEEEPGHTAWKSRERALFQVADEVGQTVVEVGSRRLTSFLSICEACGLDPDAVRQRAREMTVESIMHTGRHIERRKSQKGGESLSLEAHSVLVDVDMDALEAELQGGSSDYYDSRDGYGIDHAW